MLLLVPPAMLSSPAQDMQRVELEHYGIKVPTGFSLKSRDLPMMDFEVWDITRAADGKVVGMIYLGNHPDCPDLKKLGGEVKHTKAGEWVLKAELKNDSGHLESLLEAEGVRYKTQDYSVWSRVHVNLNGLTPEELAQWRKAILEMTIVHPIIE